MVSQTSPYGSGGKDWPIIARENMNVKIRTFHINVTVINPSDIRTKDYDHF